MGRCYACCQENCGYGPCSCSCHAVEKKYQAVEGARTRAEDMVKRGMDLNEAGREIARAKTLEHPCPTHRRYRVKRRPATACEHCWRMWIGVNP